MLTASGIRSTFSSWFNYQSATARKRPASNMETPPRNENADPNIPLCPRKKRRAIPRRSELIDLNNKGTPICRRLFNDPPQETKISSTTRLSISDGKGPLEILPDEILHHIISLLDTNSLVQLGHVSKDLNNCVISYLLCNPGFKHVLSFEKGKYKPSHYSQAGDTLRKITATKNLRHRLRIASQLSVKMKPICDKLLQSAGSALAYKCFGKLFFHYVSSWSEYDKLRAYCFIEKQTKLNQKVSNVLKLSPGALPWHEYDLRQLVQSTLLEPSYSDDEFGFWLSQLLKGIPLTHQARLLYIFTGPTDNAGFVYWSACCDCSSPTHNLEQSTIGGERDMTGLARSLRVLLLTGRDDWTMDTIISVFDEMTTTPAGWCLGQVATLLMLSGKDVTQAVLGNRAINGHISDLSVIAYYLAHACVKEDTANGNSTKLKWYVEVIRYAVNMMTGRNERKWFAYTLIHHWQSYLTSLFEEIDISDDLLDFESIREEFVTSLNCLSQLTIILLAIHNN